jgi:polyphosphate kinase
MNLNSYTRWDNYTRCRDDMFQATDTARATWFIARSDNKRQARLDIIAHLLSSIPYKKVPRGKIKLPKRKVARSKPLRTSLRIVPSAG